jgi:hypothetical protein
MTRYLLAITSVLVSSHFALAENWPIRRRHTSAAERPDPPENRHSPLLHWAVRVVPLGDWKR